MMTDAEKAATEVILGVDTHLDVHVAVALDHLGRRLGELSVPTTAKGYERLVRWAEGFGTLRCAGVEGTSSYGAAITRYLRTAEIAVREVERPKRRHLHRSSKSDSRDAESAARAVLAGETAGEPKSADGRVEMIRALRTARRSALKSRTQAANQLQGLRVTAPDEEDQACWRAARPLQTGTRHRRLRDTFLLRGGLLRPVRGHHRGARAGFSFTFGTLARELTDRLRENGTHVVGTATTVEEGTRLERDGVDAVVAQGAEAGGHRGTFLGDVQDSLIGTMALVPQMVDALSIPVIAAGGIMDGRGLAAALTLGAEAVQMGTAFLTCEESGAHHAFKNAVLESTEDQTAITRAFSGRAARGIENRFLVEVGAHEQEIPPFPVQNALTRDVRAAAQEQNRPEFMSLWSGQGLRLARSNTAAELIRSAITGAEAALAGAAGKTRSVAE